MDLKLVTAPSMMQAPLLLVLQIWVVWEKKKEHESVMGERKW